MAFRSRRWRRLLCVCGVAYAVVCSSGFAQTARDRAVELNAIVSENPARIRLEWQPLRYPVATQTVSRRSSHLEPWGTGTAVPTAHRYYVDTNVSPGTAYEYRVVIEYQGGSPAPAYGYLLAGIGLPAVEQRGRVILIVDASKAGALGMELARLERDLVGDGWTVARADVDPSSTPLEVRGVIRGLYEQSQATTHALLLVGSVPVAQSGDIQPDGHPETRGAWPTDVFYADMDGVWTDESVDRAGRNVPGDGKFDQSSISLVGNGLAELQTGRIDMANMSWWPESETELLRRYLNRNHDFRHGIVEVPRRGLLKDYSFGYFGGEAFAAVGWRAFSTFFGPNNVTETAIFPESELRSYLVGYACGGGTQTSMDAVSSTDFRDRASKMVFNFFFGSGFLRWDSANNFLRAPLAGSSGSLALTAAWTNRPDWYLHHMAMGSPIGLSVLLNQNSGNSAVRGYFFADGIAPGASETMVPGGVHMALMGDPTLRLHVVKSPSHLSLSAGDSVVLQWQAAPDIARYRIYRSLNAGGPFALIGSTAGTSYEDSSPSLGAENFYMIRSERLETSGSGTYWNLSQGVMGSVVVNGTPPSALGPDLVPDAAASANPRSVATGETVSLAATVRNVGDAEAGFSRLRVLLRGMGGNFLLGERSVEKVPAGGAVAVSINDLIVPGNVSAGTYDVEAIIDARDEVNESNETNNALVLPNALSVRVSGPVVLQMWGADYRLYGALKKRKAQRMSGRISRTPRGKYEKAWLRAAGLVNLSQTATSGPLSFELCAMPTRNAYHGKIKFARSLGALPPQASHGAVFAKGRARHYSKRLYPQIVVWELTAQGWVKRTARTYPSRRRM